MDDLLLDAVRRVGAVCLALPETREEDAWVGVRWRVRQQTFAHVCAISGGRPEGYARAAGVDSAAVVLVFHADPSEAEAFAHLGPPWFKPAWSPTVAGRLLDVHTDWATDWDEVAELLTDSYCLRAPRKLAALVDRPPTG